MANSPASGASSCGGLDVVCHGERPADVPEPVDPATVGTPLGDRAGDAVLGPIRIGRPPRRSDYRR